MLYKNATVCVLNYSSEALHEAQFLAELGAQVHFVSSTTSDEIAALQSKGIELHYGKAQAIEGDMLGVTGVRTKDELIACQGVFILRPSVAPASLLSSLELNEKTLKVDERMRTNIAGVFAAGDCVGKPLQVAKAVGEGQLACFSAVEYLDGH
jgi:thioredoxin reductase (NADPH)